MRRGRRWVRRMRWIGVGHRKALAGWIDTAPAEIDCLELTAEHFYDASDAVERIARLGERYPLLVHGLGLSLGTPGPLDRQRLAKFASVARAADARWVSEHVAFTRVGSLDLGHLNPVSLGHDSLALLVDHAVEVAETCGKQLLLENITSHVRVGDGAAETDFLNALCERARCGLLLDVTNLVVNAHNHRFDASEWVRQLDPKHVVQLHIAGYRGGAGRWEDMHADGVQADVLELTRTVLATCNPRAIILERDADFPSHEELVAELVTVRAACA